MTLQTELTKLRGELEFLQDTIDELVVEKQNFEIKVKALESEVASLRFQANSKSKKKTSS